VRWSVNPQAGKVPRGRLLGKMVAQALARDWSFYILGAGGPQLARTWAGAALKPGRSPGNSARQGGDSQAQTCAKDYRVLTYAGMFFSKYRSRSA
jgi:hypothetical protein